MGGYELQMKDGSVAKYNLYDSSTYNYYETEIDDPQGNATLIRKGPRIRILKEWCSCGSIYGKEHAASSLQRCDLFANRNGWFCMLVPDQIEILLCTDAIDMRK